MIVDCSWSYSIDDIFSDVLSPTVTFADLTIDQIDKQIIEHEGALSSSQPDRINVQHHRAIAKYRGHRNEITDVIFVNLPAEIFRDIVLLYRALFTGRFPADNRWFKIAHVCRRWRNFVLSIPPLFSQLLLSKSPTNNDVMNEFLLLSGHTSLQLVCKQQTQPILEIIPRITNHLDRIEKISLTQASYNLWREYYPFMCGLNTLAVSGISRPFELPFPPSSLKRLSITFNAFHDVRALRILDTLAHLPSLEDLRLGTSLFGGLGQRPENDTMPHVPTHTHSIRLKRLFLQVDHSNAWHVLEFVHVIERICVIEPWEGWEDNRVLQVIHDKLISGSTFPSHVEDSAMLLWREPNGYSVMELMIGNVQSVHWKLVGQPLNFSDDVPVIAMPKVFLRFTASTESDILLGQTYTRTFSQLQRLLVNPRLSIRPQCLALAYQCHNIGTLEVLCFEEDTVFDAIQLLTRILGQTGPESAMDNGHFRCSMLRTVAVRRCANLDEVPTCKPRARGECFEDLNKLLLMRRQLGLELELLEFDLSDEECEVDIKKDVYRSFENVVARLVYRTPGSQ